MHVYKKAYEKEAETNTEKKSSFSQIEINLTLRKKDWIY
jgi:hypothetical protein